MTSEYVGKECSWPILTKFGNMIRDLKAALKDPIGTV